MLTSLPVDNLGKIFKMVISEKELRTMYLDLIQKVIVNEIYKDPPLERSYLSRKLAKLGFYTRHETGKSFNKTNRDSGLDWPSMAHTMIGNKRMSNLRYVLEDVIQNNVAGDFIETGVWRGGACIYAKAIFNSYGISDRKVWVADSFVGLPKPDVKKYKLDKGDLHSKEAVLSVSRKEVENNFQVYGLLDDNVTFLEGWFKDTLITAPIKKVSVLRLDGDMYESTMDALLALYKKVTPNGYIIVDDYHAVEGCRKAIHDYLDENCRDENVEITDIDGIGVFWKRKC